MHHRQRCGVLQSGSLDVPTGLVSISPEFLTTRTFRLWTLWWGITRLVLRVAAQYVAQWSTVPRPTSVPLWMEEFRGAFRSQQRASTHFRAHHTLDNLISSKSFRAKAHPLNFEAKQMPWTAFTSCLSRSTFSDVVWNKLRRMPGKYTRTIIPHLTAGDVVLTSQAEIANIRAPFSSTVCSSDNCDSELRAI
jgi:hypothetical protein